MTRPRISYLIVSLLFTLTWARPASADLVLSFDSSSYTIPGVGDTTSVQVLVSQTSGGPQVGTGNELLTAGIELSFPTLGSAIVASTSDVTPGPAWDSSSINLTTSGPNTLVDLGLTSLLGISDLSTPLLLGTFVFTGQSPGMTSISVATITPGANFITANGNILDPTNTGTATILVSTPTSIPEPNTLVICSLAGLTTGAGWLRRRARIASAG
jgi:hypothetical protein